MLRGLLAGAVVVGVVAVLPEMLAFPFVTVVLGLVTGVFPGIAMGNPEEGRPGLEWTVAVGITAVGMSGLWISPMVVAAAWVLRGFWDLLHHVTSLGNGVPEGYPGFCLAFDLVLAGFVTYLWLAG
ncbi:DUF6010 family protein [Gemmatimonadota bacterium]